MGGQSLEVEVCAAAGSRGRRAGDRRRPLGAADGILLAQPDRGSAIPDTHGLRGHGTRGCGVTNSELVAFYVDRDGQMDVWVTQVGSGQFHNLTRGSAKDIANPLLRALGFSPDGSLVTFWLRKEGSAGGSGIGVWAVPTLGGQPGPYLEGVAEYDWSRDGSRLAYHTPGPGDPLFVSSGDRRVDGPPIYTAPSGLHRHFRRGRPTRHLSTSCRVPFPTNWISGASRRPAELLND